MATISAPGTKARSAKAASSSSAATCRRRRSRQVSRAVSCRFELAPMSDTRAEIASVVERARPVQAAAAVVGAHFLGDTAVFVLGEQSLLLVPRDGEARSIPAHAGAILA